MEQESVLKDLGDGLILRRGTAEDAEALADFNAVVNTLTGEPDEGMRAWTLDLMKGDLPDFGPGDFTIVVDTKTGSIVSTQNLIPQTWAYGGIEFPAARIELVGTDPDYRRRGLVRAQTDIMHEWSAQLGQKVIGITGIPWFYRQFGYEMALEHLGWRTGYAQNVPELPAGETEPYRVRVATDADIPFLKRTSDHGNQRYLVSCVRDEELWRYELHSRREESPHRHEIRVVETARGEPVGLLVHHGGSSGGLLTVRVYELSPGTPWPAVTPSVLRYLRKAADEYADRDGGEKFTGFTFMFGSEHPAYDAAKDQLPVSSQPYAWYMRVADMPDFIGHIGPVLERRLNASMASGYTGELKISFIRNGLRVAFKDGRLVEAQRWMPTQLDSRFFARVRDAMFPSLTFLQLLFGFRSVEELEYAFPDCVISSGEARELLNVLFPKQISRIWGVE